MSSLPRCLFALALSLGCAGLTSTANCQRNAAKKVLANTVSGRVTIHGKAAPGITVGIRGQSFSQQPVPSLKATTDADGNYRVTGITAGNYQVSPIAPAYVLAEFLPSRGRSKTLILAEGEDVQGIDFSMERGGVITGKVTDAEGRPVIEERITLVLENQTREQRQPPIVENGFQTDDRGIYRIYGIPEGSYKVALGQADDDPYSNPRFGRVPYKRTYYPDATDPDDAKVIEVTEGSEVTNIDITVGRNLPSFAASGNVVDGETGRPVMGLRFGVRRLLANGSTTPPIMTTSNSQGEFRLENVTPGKYALVLMPQPGSEVTAEGVPFEVIDQDVTGLLVRTAKGLTIAGTVVFEGTNDKGVLAKLADLRLSAFVQSDTPNYGFGHAATLNSDGSFRVGGLSPGTVNFYLTAQDRLQPAFNILRVERDGVAQSRNLEIKAGENLTGVKIVLSYGTGSIRGEVKLENGALPEDSRILVWVKRLEDTDSNNRIYNADARGHFLIEGVPAGTYELNVSVNISGRSSSPPAKRSVSVADGAVTDVEVSLDLKLNEERLPKP